ncbi:MAG: hypothetical protein J5934_07615 [Succinivibrio sp.]|nr:hypothetical protein [Succinivibrio sp.]
MKKNRMLIMAAACLLLTGCRTELEVNTSYSELTTKALHTKTALASIEVASCSSPEDSRIPSDSLTEMQKLIPNVFKGAKFKECYTRKMNSFASFNIPVGIGKIDSGSSLDNDLNIISQEDGAILAQANEDFYRRFRQFLKEQLVDDLDMKISVTINNDSGKDIKLNCYSVYVDKTPCPLGSTVVKSKSDAVFVLSDVSADVILMKDRKNDRVMFAGKTDN